jgi:hypothetical protein
MEQTPTLHQHIADKFRQVADLLAQQGANPFRVNAYRRAANTVAGLQQGVRTMFTLQGREGLLALPTLGESIASAICEILHTGRWSQLLHTQRDAWHFTVLFSNTARAHELHRTHDWVVMYFYENDHQEGQRTVVTETHGPLLGKRVVRGREAECRTYYATPTPAGHSRLHTGRTR